MACNAWTCALQAIEAGRCHGFRVDAYRVSMNRANSAFNKLSPNIQSFIYSRYSHVQIVPCHGPLLEILLKRPFSRENTGFSSHKRFVA